MATKDYNPLPGLIESVEVKRGEKNQGFESDRVEFRMAIIGNHGIGAVSICYAPDGWRWRP